MAGPLIWGPKGRAKSLTKNGISLKSTSTFDNEWYENLFVNGRAEDPQITPAFKTYRGDPSLPTGAGGTPVSVQPWAMTENSGEVISGLRSWKLSRTTTNAAGEGWAYEFSVPSSHLAASGGVITLNMNCRTSIAVANLQLYIYDVTNSVLLGDGPFIGSTTSTQKIQVTFTPTNGTSYRLLIHNLTFSSSAVDVFVDDIYLTTNFAERPATNLVSGLMSTIAQSFNGIKTFNSGIKASASSTTLTQYDGPATLGYAGTSTPGLISTSPQNIPGFKAFPDGGSMRGGTTAPAFGYVGELMQAIVSTPTGAANTDTANNLTSVILTPGRWLINASVHRAFATATATYLNVALVPSSLGGGTLGVSASRIAFNTATSMIQTTMHVPTQVVTVASNTQYYLTYYCVFTGANGTVSGAITAVRLAGD